MALNFPKGIAAFHVKVYKVVEDPSTDAIISWGKDNNSFVIWNLEELISSKILWRFHCRKFPEFHSELRYYVSFLYLFWNHLSLSLCFESCCYVLLFGRAFKELRMGLGNWNLEMKIL